MAERTNAQLLKSCEVQASVGSNPTPSAVVTADRTPEELLLRGQLPPAVETRRRAWHVTRRGRWVFGTIAFCVLAAAVGDVVADQVDQRDQFNRSEASLSVTRQHIAAVAAQLAALQRNLLAVGNQVQSDTTALSQDASQLKGAQTALSAAQADVTQQSSMITSLQTCLGGVEQALNALSVSNQLRAFVLLESVSSSCTAAADSSG
jgi:hypothetical protein